MYQDKFTGNPFDKLSDRLPKQLKDKCENGHDMFLISNCMQCGAPICCPTCCDEAKAELTPNSQANRPQKAVRVEPVVRFLFRPHRELLAESMREVREFSSREKLVNHLQRHLDTIPHHGKYDANKISIEKYGDGVDVRIGWDTYIVHLAGYGVLGFTNGKV